MASKRDRERKLERARTERRIAKQAQKARQRRQVQAIVGASVALILIVLGVIFVLKPFSGSNTPEAGGCLWVPVAVDSSNPGVKDVGTPPTSGEPTTGTETMTIATKDQGNIVITLDLDESPCAAASFAYLASHKYFDGTTCNLLSAQLKVLKCGDWKGDGSGSPSYQFADEFIPQEPLAPTASASPLTPSASPSANASGPFYSTGQVVMVNTGKDTNGSQFYIIYGDGSSLSNAYTVIGNVTSGMDAITKVAAAGAVDAQNKPVAEGKPKTPVTITTLTVSTPDENASPSDSASPGVPQS